MSIVEDYLRQPSFINVVLSVWFRELDFMYDIVSNTEASDLWHRNELSSYLHPRFAALLSIMLALTAQLHARDLDVCLDISFGDHVSSASLITPAVSLARSRLEAVLTYPEGAHDILAEQLQAHFLLCAFYKNTGQKEQYRALLLQGISHFFNASYHIMDAFDEDCCDSTNMMATAPNSLRILTPTQRGLVRRIFWNFFVCDRLFVMLGGASTSYMINVSHCDIWLICRDEEGCRSVQEVCQESRRSSKSKHSRSGTRQIGSLVGNDQSESLTLDPLLPYTDSKTGSVSAYIEALVDIAATSGRCLDVVGDIRSRRRQAATKEQIGEQCSDQASIIEDEMENLRRVYCFSSHDAVIRCSDAFHAMDPRQRQVLKLTVLRLQRDLAMEMSSLLRGVVPEMGDWLEERQSSTARALLKHGLAATLDVPPCSMGWIFFLHFVAEPTRSLLNAVHGHHKEASSASAKENVSLAMRGRNLLCLIAVQSCSSVALTWAHQLCERFAETILDPCAFRATEVGEQEHDESIAQSFGVFRAAHEAIRDVSRSISANKFADAFIRLRAVKLVRSGSRNSSDASEISTLFSTGDGHRSPHVSRPQMATSKTTNSGVSSHEDETTDTAFAGILMDNSVDKGIVSRPALDSNEAPQHWTEMEASTALDMLLSLPSPLVPYLTAADEDAGV